MKEKKSPQPPAVAPAYSKFLFGKRPILLISAVIGTLFLWNNYTNGSFLAWPVRSQGPIDELQGLVYFLAKVDKILPARLETDKPVDPDVWSGGQHLTNAEWRERAAELRRTHPVVIFSKTYCPYSKNAKALFNEYPLKTPPFVVEVDIRPDGPKVKSLLSRITSHSTFPNVIVGGKSLRGFDAVSALHDEDKLHGILKSAGAL